MKIPPLEANLFHADRRRDMTKLKAAFPNFANASKKNITSSVYDCTVEDVEYSSHLVVVITLP